MGVRAAAVIALLLGGAVPAAAGAAETITVSSTAGSLGAGVCTLRDAITLAGVVSNPALPSAAEAATDCSGRTSGSGTPYTVVLDDEATYTLDTVDDYWFGPDGLPPISDTVTIEGNGSTIARSAAVGTPDFRLFYVSGGLSGIPSGSLTLRNLTLTGGVAKGGDAAGGGGGAGMGGAVFTQGTLTIDHSTVSGNTAQGGSSTSGQHGGGGGIGEDAQTTDGGGFGGPAPGAAMGAGGLDHSTTFNGSGGGGFGAGDDATRWWLINEVQEVVLCDTCHGGGHGGFGGGQYDAAQSPSRDQPHGAGDGGSGGDNIDHIPAAGGDGGFGGASGGGGGGVGGGGGAGRNNGGGGGGGFGGGGGQNNFTTSPDGDGGFGGGAGATVADNGAVGSAGFGGGAVGSTVGINGTGGGGGALGGAVFSLFGTVTVIESTIAGNSVTGGTPNGSGLGGGVFNVDGDVSITGSTIAANTATGHQAFGGVYTLAFGNTIAAGGATSATVSATRSILYGNTGSDLYANRVAGVNANSSAVTLTASNVVGVATTAGGATSTGTAITADPQLAPLGDDGGPQATMRPAVTGSAHGAATACSATDELGNPRGAPACDLGALELTTIVPAITTGTVTGLGRDSATLHGTVDPGGAVTSYAFELSSDDFATFLTVPAGRAGPGSSAVAVTRTATGLPALTRYQVRLTATNSGATVKDPSPTAFMTGAVPTATTGPAIGVSETTATLTGQVNPNGADANYHFELSTDPQFASVTTLPSAEAGAGNAAVAVAAEASGLAASTTYYYRVIAVGANGTTAGAVVQLTTLTPPSPPPLPLPPLPPTTPPSPAAPKTTSSGSVTVRFSGSSVRVGDGHTVACPAGAGGCSVKLVATVPGPTPKTRSKKKKRSKPKPIVIATATISIPAASRRALTFRLNATGRRLLKARHTLTATVTLTITYATSRHMSTTHRLVLHQPKSKPPKKRGATRS